MADRCELHTAVPGEGATTGPFAMRFLRVTHSIPDGMAVAVDTPFGTILHTGDFKIDQTPLDGRPTDLHGLAEEASGRGVHLLLSDSTNAEEAGYTSSERSVGPVLQRIVAGRPRARRGGLLLQPHPPDPADRERRHRERAGGGVPRALHAHQRAGGPRAGAAARGRPRRRGHRGGPRPRSRPRRRDLHRLAGRAVLGAQPHGQPPAQVGEAGGRRHGRAVVVPDPGNEPAIHRVVDALYRTGADVYHMPADAVHASGHAAQEELRLMLSLVRPAGSSRSTASAATCSTTRGSRRRSGSRTTT